LDQIGVLLAANAAYAEARIAQHLGYGGALAMVAASVLIGGALVIALGSERRASDLE
jgi:hypothetical protein